MTIYILLLALTVGLALIWNGIIHKKMKEYEHRLDYFKQCVVDVELNNGHLFENLHASIDETRKTGSNDNQYFYREIRRLEEYMRVFQLTLHSRVTKLEDGSKDFHDFISSIRGDIEKINNDSLRLEVTVNHHDKTLNELVDHCFFDERNEFMFTEDNEEALAYLDSIREMYDEAMNSITMLYESAKKGVFGAISTSESHEDSNIETSSDVDDSQVCDEGMPIDVVCDLPQTPWGLTIDEFANASISLSCSGKAPADSECNISHKEEGRACMNISFTPNLSDDEEFTDHDEDEELILKPHIMAEIVNYFERGIYPIKKRVEHDEVEELLLEPRIMAEIVNYFERGIFSVPYLAVKYDLTEDQVRMILKYHQVDLNTDMNGDLREL